MTECCDYSAIVDAINGLSSNFDEINGDLARLEEKLERLDRKVDEIDREGNPWVDILIAAIRALEGVLVAAIDNAKEFFSQSLQTLRAAINQIPPLIREIAPEIIDKIAFRFDGLKSDIRELNGKIDKLEGKTEKLFDEHSETHRKLNRLESLLDDLGDNSWADALLAAVIAAIAGALAPLIAQVTRLAGSIADLAASLPRQIDRALDILSALRRDVSKLLRALNDGEDVDLSKLLREHSETQRLIKGIDDSDSSSRLLREHAETQRLIKGIDDSDSSSRLLREHAETQRLINGINDSDSSSRLLREHAETQRLINGINDSDSSSKLLREHAETQRLLRQEHAETQRLLRSEEGLNLEPVLRGQRNLFSGLNSQHRETQRLIRSLDDGPLLARLVREHDQTQRLIRSLDDGPLLARLVREHEETQRLVSEIDFSRLMQEHAETQNILKPIDDAFQATIDVSFETTETWDGSQKSKTYGGAGFKGLEALITGVHHVQQLLRGDICELLEREPALAVAESIDGRPRADIPIIVLTYRAYDHGADKWARETYSQTIFSPTAAAVGFIIDHASRPPDRHTGRFASRLRLNNGKILTSYSRNKVESGSFLNWLVKQVEGREVPPSWKKLVWESEDPYVKNQTKLYCRKAEFYPDGQRANKSPTKSHQFFRNSKPN